jgi:hypothetical protein
VVASVRASEGDRVERRFFFPLPNGWFQLGAHEIAPGPVVPLRCCLLSDGDVGIPRLRHWVRQFYSGPNAAESAA